MGAWQPMTDRVYTVLLYSNDARVRDQMRLAVGTHPAVDLTVKFVEASTHHECFRLVDDGGIDLMLLDGDATPAGGLGIVRQIKDEHVNAPLTCVAISRAADRWLASYAEVDATLMYPLDPIVAGETVAALLGTAPGSAVNAA